MQLGLLRFPINFIDISNELIQILFTKNTVLPRMYEKRVRRIIESQTARFDYPKARSEEEKSSGKKIIFGN